MAAKVLVAAQDLASGYKKGDIVSVLPDSADWGGKETLPNFIRLNVSDATKEQADAYLAQWGKVFAYTIVNENAQGYRIRVEVDPLAVSAGGNGAEVKQELKDFVLDGLSLGWTVQFVSQTATSLTVDVAKPVTLADGKAAMDDIFSEVIDTSRYYFAASDVDAVISAGGEVTRTKAQITAIIKDKLDD